MTYDQIAANDTATLDAMLTALMDAGNPDPNLADMIIDCLIDRERTDGPAFATA